MSQRLRRPGHRRCRWAYRATPSDHVTCYIQLLSSEQTGCCRSCCSICSIDNLPWRLPRSLSNRSQRCPHCVVSDWASTLRKCISAVAHCYEVRLGLLPLSLLWVCIVSVVFVVSITMGVRLNWVELISRRKTSRFASHNKGVGTAGATGALAPGMLKPRVRKLLLVCTCTVLHSRTAEECT